jgi:CRP-like cAMP-binding protein
VVGDGAVVRTVEPGDAFGEIALVLDRPRTATVRAGTDLDLVVLDRDVFLDAVGYSLSAETADAVVARHLARFCPAGFLA